MKIPQDILRSIGYTPGCAKCRKQSRNEYSHPGLAHSEDCRTRIEVASRTAPVYRDRAERAEQREDAKEVEIIDHSRRSSLEPYLDQQLEIRKFHAVTQKVKIIQVFGMSNGPVESQNRTCQVKSLFQVQMDETLTPPKIPAVPSSSTPSSSTSIPISLGASSSSGVQRTHSESTMLPNSPGVSSGSGVKRAHGDSIVNDDEEKLGTRAWMSALIAGLHGVNPAEDDEICSGDGITDEWLSSRYPETHMRQKMVNEAKRKEIDRFKKDEGVSCCHKEIPGKGRRGEDDQHQVGRDKQRYRRSSNCQGTPGGTRV